jgi:ATP-dependent DNA helicase DinG
LLEGLLQLVDFAFESVFEFVQGSSQETGLEKKLRITDEVRARDEMRNLYSDRVEPLVMELTAAAGKLGAAAVVLSKAKGKDEKADFTLDQAELNAYAMKFRTISAFIAQIFNETGQEDTIQWIETKDVGMRVVRVCSAPLDVSSALVDTVYPNIRTIVMTSATLSVEGRLDFLKRRLGLDRVEQGRVSERILPSPFDFEKQAVIGVPLDIADPSSPQYIDQAAEMIMECLRITRGKAFVLFTSFGALNRVAKQLCEPLKEEGITSLRQGMAPRHKLLEMFKKDVHSVLFATDSFWEGVDVAGEALECVILAKLPFRVPTEPVLEARAEKIERDGGNSFVEYTVPQAVIRFRQGFGRLIRRRSDRGAIIILDNRVLTRSYGSVFLRSLPDARLMCTKREEVLAAVREFFEGNLR